MSDEPEKFRTGIRTLIHRFRGGGFFGQVRRDCAFRPTSKRPEILSGMADVTAGALGAGAEAGAGAGADCANALLINAHSVSGSRVDGMGRNSNLLVDVMSSHSS